jgi:hypothetical protein
MTSDTSPRPVSPLRARMIEDTTVRGFNEDTRRDYVRRVRAFAPGSGPDPMSFLLVSWQHPLAGTFRSGVTPISPCRLRTLLQHHQRTLTSAVERQRQPICNHRRLSHLGQLTKSIPRRRRYSDKSP